jgi:uncharacterized protein
VHRVEELTPQRLCEWSIRALLLDVDCTLTRYGQEEVTPEVAEWIEQLRTAGIGLCLVSNGLSERIGRFSQKLDLPCVARAMKPLPRGLRSAMRNLQALPAETAMVGDQLFADVLASRLAGVRAILVQPIHLEDEPWFTRLKRPPERFLLSRLNKSNPCGDCTDC